LGTHLAHGPYLNPWTISLPPLLVLPPFEPWIDFLLRLFPKEKWIGIPQPYYNLIHHLMNIKNGSDQNPLT